MPSVMRDAIRYWEPRRLAYNVALAILATGWVLVTWPHFRSAFTLRSFWKLLILAAMANLCYCAAYVVDVPMQHSPFGTIWRRWRWALWLSGTLLALLVAYYWIADEIYPFVGDAGLSSCAFR
jgi:hypothetical protein